MKKIKFLLVLSGIPLSCSDLTQPNVLNAQPGNKQHPNKTKKEPKKQDVKKKKNAAKKINTLPASIADHSKLIGKIHHAIDKIKPNILLKYILNELIKRYSEDIQQHHNANYRFKSDSSSILYLEELHKQEDFHKNFFNYMSKWHSLTSETDNYIKYLLQLAVFSKSPKVVWEFIKFLKKKNIKANIDAKDPFWISILHYAIASGHKEMVEVLIKYGPMLHIYEKDQALDLPALFDYAICMGKKEIVQVLIDAHANPNFIYDSERMLRNGNGLMLAEVYDQKDVAIYFLKNNCIENLDQQDMHGQTVLMRIASSMYPGWHKIFYKLLEKADIKVIDYDHKNVLMHLLTRCGFAYCTDKNKNTDLCNDKIAMVQALCNHKDIAQILNKKYILAYIRDCLYEIDKVSTYAGRTLHNILTKVLQPHKA